MTADTLDPAGVSLGTIAGTLLTATAGGAHRRPIAGGLRRIQPVEAPAIGRSASPYPCHAERSDASWRWRNAALR